MNDPIGIICMLYLICNDICLDNKEKPLEVERDISLSEMPKKRISCGF